MPGVIYIVAGPMPWGPVRIESAGSMPEFMGRITTAPAHYEQIEAGDPECIAELARSMLKPAADQPGWLMGRVQDAFLAVKEARQRLAGRVTPEIPPMPMDGQKSGPTACVPVDQVVSVPVERSVEPEPGAHDDIPARRQALTGESRRWGPVPADVDVRAIRVGLGMSQPAFAGAFGFQVATLRDWEQGRTVPDSAVRTLLLVIAARPDVVREVVEGYGVPVVARAGC